MDVEFATRETLDVRDAARVLGVGEKSLRRAVAAGHMPTVTVPGVRRVLFSREWIESILRGEATTENRRDDRARAAA